MLPIFAAALLLAPTQVRFTETQPGKFQLLVDGKPFFVKGAGAPKDRLAELARYGANSVRTWGVDADTKDLLDAAQRQGMKVCVGFWMRKGDGFSYRKESDLAEQADDLRKWVREYRNHPALLMWAVGNEVELEGEQPECFIQTEALAKLVKTEDPNHPVITVVADMWSEKQALIEKYWRSLDAIGVNSYDGLPTVMQRMKFWKKPVLITEWQFSLPSSDPAAPWVGFTEPSSAEKDASTRKNYQSVILGSPGRVLGSYFFYWGKSDTGTASLLNPFLNDGSWQPVVRTMATLWGGKVPKNHAPTVRVVEPAGSFRVKPSEEIVVRVTAADADKDAVDLSYEIVPNDPKKRFIGDFEQAVGVTAKGSLAGATRIGAPKQPGQYRIVFIARDGKGAATLASRSFLVE